MGRFVLSGKSVERAACVLFLAFAIGFIGADIIRASGSDWKGWWASVGRGFGIGVNHDEIRDYVEFVQVETPRYTVYTGIAYASSWSRSVTDQWCYAVLKNQPEDQPQYRLTLAETDKSGTVVLIKHSVGRLRPFGLSAAETKKLTSSRCRFSN